jgi:hypothetical protein
MLAVLAGCAAPERSAESHRPAAPPPPAAESGKIAGGELLLDSSGQRCTVTPRTGQAETRLVTELSPPCALMRDHKGEIQTYRYEDAGGAQVYVVAGEMKGECGLSAQGVLVRSSGATLSKLVQRGSYKCPKSGLDERDFWLFAHR